MFVKNMMFASEGRMVGCPFAMTDGCARGKVGRTCALKEQILIGFVSDRTSWNPINEGECLQPTDKVGVTGHCNIPH